MNFEDLTVGDAIKLNNKIKEENMAQTKGGGIKAKESNLAKYGEDYYRKIGSLGGRARGPKGFAMMTPEQRAEAGRKGGRRSRRNGVSTGQGKKKEYYYSGDGVFKPVESTPEPKKKSFIDKVLGR